MFAKRKTLGDCSLSEFYSIRNRFWWNFEISSSPCRLKFEILSFPQIEVKLENEFFGAVELISELFLQSLLLPMVGGNHLLLLSSANFIDQRLRREVSGNPPPPLVSRPLIRRNLHPLPQGSSRHCLNSSWLLASARLPPPRPITRRRLQLTASVRRRRS